MLDLLLVAVSFAAQPVAFFGCLALGVVARSALHAALYAVGWALAMQFFVTLTGAGFADPAGLLIHLLLRIVGAVVVALAVHFIYRAMRRGGSGGSGAGNGTGGGTRQNRPNHLRRVK